MFGDEIFHGGFAFLPCHDSNDTHGRTLSHGFCELVCILTSVSDFSFSTLDRSSVHHSWERHDGSLDGPWLAALNLRGALKATKLTAILWSPFH